MFCVYNASKLHRNGHIYLEIKSSSPINIMQPQITCIYLEYLKNGRMKEVNIYKKICFKYIINEAPVIRNTLYFMYIVLIILLLKCLQQSIAHKTFLVPIS